MTSLVPEQINNCKNALKELMKIETITDGVTHNIVSKNIQTKFYKKKFSSYHTNIKSFRVLAEFFDLMH